MREAASVMSLIALLAGSCTVPMTDQQQRLAAAAPAEPCVPEHPGALVLGRSEAASSTHHMVVSSSLSFVRLLLVEGPCASEIAHYNAGGAALYSGERFQFLMDGTIRRYPGSPWSRSKTPVQTIPSLSGYDLVQSVQTGTWKNPLWTREAYIGLFKGRSNHVIASFELWDGKPSTVVEVLIRSTSPIASVDYLPAPDSPGGRIGIVQPAGADRTWLYTYDWHPGDIRLLPM